MDDEIQGIGSDDGTVRLQKRWPFLTFIVQIF